MKPSQYEYEVVDDAVVVVDDDDDVVFVFWSADAPRGLMVSFSIRRLWFPSS